MKRLIITIFAIFLVSGCFAQYTWNKIALPVEVTINDIFFVNADTGFIVGQTLTNNGIMLKSINGGDKWTEVSINSSSTYRSMQNIDFVNCGFCCRIQ